MSEWYYSDASRNRHGPIGAEELAALHASGVLQPDTLVWREGMGDWKPWREMIPEVVYGSNAHAPAASTQAMEAPPSVSTAADDGAYRPYAIAEASPYAPPQARVEENDKIVTGGRVVYAGFWKRVAASIIDGFVTNALVYAVQIPMMMIFGVSMVGIGASDNPFASGAGIAVLGLIYLISIMIPLMYFSWMHSSKNQASLGKMAVGIKVTRSNGERITFWRAFGRYWAQIPGALILGGGYVMAAFTERKQALHDIICDTLVVDKHAYTEHPEWQREELGTVTIVILALFGLLLVGFVVMFGAIIAVLGSGLH